MTVLLPPACYFINLPHPRNRPKLREAIQLVSLFPESKNVKSSLYIIPNDCDSPSPMKCRIKLPTNNTADDPIEDVVSLFRFIVSFLCYNIFCHQFLFCTEEFWDYITLLIQGKKAIY
jgi:hypothetical protein